MLQFFSASTNIVNSRRAITECLEVALEGEPNLDCDLIIIYTAMGHNFKELLFEANRLSPGAWFLRKDGSPLDLPIQHLRLSPRSTMNLTFLKECSLK